MGKLGKVGAGFDIFIARMNGCAYWYLYMVVEARKWVDWRGRIKDERVSGVVRGRRAIWKCTGKTIILRLPI